MTDHEKEQCWRQRQDDDHDRDMEGQDRDREAREWEEIRDDDAVWTKAARGYAHLCTERPAYVSFREYAVLLIRDQHQAAHSRAWRRDPLAPGTAIRTGTAKCYKCVFWSQGDSTCHLEYPNKWVSPTGWCGRYEGRGE
jgi:hypothetical protein